ncbi:dTDP-L-rhamnose 4-epimerase [Frankineae bacterium MT45]|nr:dTDP-L-rhamnose 4-epimerase [Frankineae bacterium MT45]
MRVLVTGGAGFIGQHLVRELQRRGHEVRVFDSLRPDVHHGVVPELDAELLVGDVRDADAVAGALAGIDGVCHLAAKVGLGVDVQDLPDYADSNDHGTAVLLAAMARVGVGRLVLASSMVVYGEGFGRCPTHGLVSPGPRLESELARGQFEPPCPHCGLPLAPALVTEDAPLDPRNAYAATKLAQEHLAAAWARSTGSSVAAMRYHNVYGPGMPRDTPYAGVAAIFLSALRRGEAPQVFEDGRQRRDFVHVRDVAAATAEALTAQPGAGVRAFNVGSGVVRTVGDMARALAASTGGPPPVVTGAYRLGDVRHITADSSRLRAELNVPAGVDFSDGMRELAEQ